MMNIETICLAKAFSKFPVYEYILEGGVTVRDKTNGIGKAVFSQELTEKYKKPAYEIFINEKRLFIQHPFSMSTLKCLESSKISFKQESGFIKIIEDRKNIIYVDPKEKDILGIAIVYCCMTKEMSMKNVVKKIQHLKTDLPSFETHLTIFNQYGVAVFGWDHNVKKYALCWASPSDEKVQMIKCSNCQRYNDGGSCFAASDNGEVNFRCTFNGYDTELNKIKMEFYLNKERAISI